MRDQATGAADVALDTPGSFIQGAPDISAIMGNMQQFLNPYTDQVIGGVNQQFDQLRGAATRSANQGAAQAGSFGGSRHGVMEGTAHGELGRAQAQTVGGLLSNQFNTALGQGINFSEYQRALQERQLQEPLFRNQMAQGFLGKGLGPVGQDTTQIQKGSVLQDVAGLGMMAAGAFTGQPGAVAAGASSMAPASFNPPANVWSGQGMGQFGSNVGGGGSYGMQPGGFFGSPGLGR